MARKLNPTVELLRRVNLFDGLTTNEVATVAGVSIGSLYQYFPNKEALVAAPADAGVANELSNYLRATGAWTGADAQIQSKAAGLVHLIAGSPEYQLI